VAVTDSNRNRPDGQGPPISQLAYHQLRQDIIHGVLRPNEVLIEGDLSERLGVSRTPVRECLQRLANDGLIVMRRRRWYVYEHTIDEIRDIYEVRAALEGYAALLACERVTAAQILAIRRAVKDLDYADVDDRVSTNDAFHDRINEACDNSRLIEEINKARLFYFNRRLAAMYQPHDMTASSAQHHAIAEAVAARRGEDAQRLVHEHIQDAYKFAALAR
jgi:DNA-binding GntR family transcriptional regulator